MSDLKERLGRKGGFWGESRNPDGAEALACIEQLEDALRELVRRFDRRDWVLSGDDSKALHYARQALGAPDER
jgi:hypothetical protein